MGDSGRCAGWPARSRARRRASRSPRWHMPSNSENNDRMVAAADRCSLGTRGRRESAACSFRTPVAVCYASSVVGDSVAPTRRAIRVPRSASSDCSLVIGASYASRFARMTTSAHGRSGRRARSNSRRVSSRRRRFTRLRSTEERPCFATMNPTRQCERGEAITRTSRCAVRNRFPSRATACSSAPRVSRWRR